MASYEVHLAVYDLSHGMARSLSLQFIGTQLDAIPHTGIVVYGKEYFYGGGIQSEDPMRFRASVNMNPLQTVSLGRTSVNQAAFEAWCSRVMQSGQFSASSYDLLTNNCNTFCQVAATDGLRVSGIPPWILDVPRRFLESPMGIMVRPMLENMQLTGPIAGAEPILRADTATTTTTIPSATASTSASNPWAHLSSTASSNNTSNAKTSETVVSKENDVKTPLLDSFTKPLLSSDVNMLNQCINKVATVAHVSDTERQALTTCQEALKHGEMLSKETAETTSAILLRALNSGGSMVFVLLLLRLVVLRTKDSILPCLEWLEAQLVLENGTGLLTSAAARSVAWLAASNAVNTQRSFDSLVPAALRDLSSDDTSQSSVRQAVSAFLYNLVLRYNDDQRSDDEELDDILVSILCASFEGLALESNTTCQRQRLMTIGRIVQPGSIRVAAAGLVVDLGFDEALEQISGQQQGQESQLASEILQVVRNI